jgi:CubicO group peptidase (beta-lactamase class C family)
MKKIHGVVLLLALLAHPAFAQNEALPTPREAAELAARPMPPVSNAGAAALTASDVAAFSDGMIPLGIAQGNIAGAVVVVVKDGQVLFAKGYGVADTATHAPVDPERTLFRPGSVSKLFTWTAVMQLVGEGKLDLDKDVNSYLDIRIPPAFGKPVTLRNLMTHTAGFEETYRSLLIGSASVEPLDQLLKESLPQRIFPPGEVPAYSNYGATLAGYIVQRVSGEPFTDYIERHIFRPLGMTHATFVQPLPAGLRADMSKGYQLASGPPTPFEMISMTPAGGLSASGGDIARFMIAHLNNGAHGANRILTPEMAVRMHGIASQPFSALSPMAYGFYHDDMNGHRIIAHGGDTGVFHSNLELVLDANTGMFMSFNSAGEGRAVSVLRRGFMKGFMDRYFPAAKASPLPTLKTAAADARLVAGSYVTSRRGDSSFARLFALQPIAVTANADGTITIPLLVNAAGIPKHWREIRPFIWQEENGASLLQANLRNGQVEQIGMEDIGPIIVLQPAPLVSARWNLWLLLATAAMFALTVLFWPVKAVLRWRYDRPLAYAGRARVLYRLTRVVALIDLVFLAGWPLGFLFAASHLASLSPSIDWAWRGLQILGVIGIVGTVIVALEFLTAVRDPDRPWWTKATDALILAATLATIWLAFSQHLLTVDMKY